MSSNSPAFLNSAENNITAEVHFMNDTQVIQQLNGNLGFDNDETMTNGAYIMDTGGNMVFVSDNDLGEVSDSDDLILSDGDVDYDITNDIIPIVSNKKRMKHNVDEMTFEELKEYSKKILANKKRYIRKYQQTAKGKEKIKKASAKYYTKNREKILQKKKEYYLKKKQMKNSA